MNGLELIENDNLLENCREMSDRFRTHFEKLKDELPIISELRIRGMMIGIDLMTFFDKVGSMR